MITQIHRLRLRAHSPKASRAVSSCGELGCRGPQTHAEPQCAAQFHFHDKRQQKLLETQRELQSRKLTYQDRVSEMNRELHDLIRGWFRGREVQRRLTATELREKEHAAALRKQTQMEEKQEQLRHLGAELQQNQLQQNQLQQFEAPQLYQQQLHPYQQPQQPQQQFQLPQYQPQYQQQQQQYQPLQDPPLSLFSEADNEQQQG
ncbi:hypothetical protein LTR08_008699 [Meristemomyces frigidus]|nr:hypothetical protein LTR08_008699 [Meristemomyces frigidus]